MEGDRKLKGKPIHKVTYTGDVCAILNLVWSFVEFVNFRGAYFLENFTDLAVSVFYSIY